MVTIDIKAGPEMTVVLGGNGNDTLYGQKGDDSNFRR